MFEDKKFNRRLARRSRILGLRRPSRRVRRTEMVVTESGDLLDIMQSPERYLITQ